MIDIEILSTKKLNINQKNEYNVHIKCFCWRNLRHFFHQNYVFQCIFPLAHTAISLSRHTEEATLIFLLLLKRKRHGKKGSLSGMTSIVQMIMKEEEKHKVHNFVASLKCQLVIRMPKMIYNVIGKMLSINLQAITKYMPFNETISLRTWFPKKWYAW